MWNYNNNVLKITEQMYNKLEIFRYCSLQQMKWSRQLIRIVDVRWCRTPVQANEDGTSCVN